MAVGQQIRPEARRHTNVAVLGSTGSIGVSTLEVIRADPGQLRAVLLSGHSNTELLLRQAREFLPHWLIVTDSEAAQRQNWAELPKNVQLVVGEEGLLGN